MPRGRPKKPLPKLPPSRERAEELVAIHGYQSTFSYDHVGGGRRHWYARGSRQDGKEGKKIAVGWHDDHKRELELAQKMLRPEADAELAEVLESDDVQRYLELQRKLGARGLVRAGPSSADVVEVPILAVGGGSKRPK